MKKQILFVDDDRNILEGLQRAFRALRNEWGMQFVVSAAEALELMAANHIDLIVADMRMSGMNGAELLGEVMKRHPAAIRMILSGHADADLIMKSVGIAHQFISKPCEPEILKLIIRSALEFGALLQDATLKNVLSNIGTLPSLPSQYYKIANELQNPETSTQRVGQIIAGDPSMTAKILQLANSAFFGRRRRVTNASEAVTYLGMDRIQHLFLAVHAFSQFKPPQTSSFSIDLLWEHSITTATLAKAIANEEEAGKEVADAAYTAGLLHDIGELIFACRLAEQHAEALALAVAKAMPLWQAEKELLSATHSEVGSYLLGLWGLPDTVVEATTYHHCPSESKAGNFCALTALHAADFQSNSRCHPGLPKTQPDWEYLAKFLKKTGIPAESPDHSDKDTENASDPSLN
jgi:HD-like signal output (HDOD) protein/ActR/RegA family two-component response regulator